MIISRYEALKAVDDIFNYCEEIDNSLPENERSGYKMLPDIHKIRKYIIDNERPHGEWEHWGSPFTDDCTANSIVCPLCKARYVEIEGEVFNFCPNCGADMRDRGDGE